MNNAKQRTQEITTRRMGPALQSNRLVHPNVLVRSASSTASLGNWGVLYDELIKAGLGIQTGANTQFQFMPTPTVAGWTDANQLYYADFYGNYASADLGPTYNKSVGTISDAYYDFINSLEYSDPSTDPKYRKLIAQQELLNQQLNDANTNSVGAYKAWVANGGTSIFPAIQNYTDWLASAPAGGQGYQKQINGLMAQLNQVTLQLTPFQTGSDLAISQAISNAAPSNMVSCGVPGSNGLTKKVYSQTISPPLAPMLNNWISGAKSHSLQITLTQNDSYSGNWHIEGGGSTGISYGIFGFFAEGGTTYDSSIEQDSSFSCQLSVQANSTFGIMRNTWFTGNLLAQYPNGPWAGKTANMYFGPQGSLKLVPSQLLVSYGTSMSLTLSQSTMTHVRTRIEAAGGLMIGPFFIGVETVSDKDVTTNSDGSQTLKIESTDNNAYITGVLSQCFYNGQ